MTVVVTGAQGFIGRYVCGSFGTSGELVVGVGRSPRSDDRITRALFDGAIEAPVPEELRRLRTSEYQYHRVDVRDKNAFLSLLSEVRPRAIVHLATPLRDDPWPLLADVAIGGTLAIAEALVESGLVCRLVLGSSASVYGRPGSLPVSEDAPCVPLDLYGIAKYAAERIAHITASPHAAVVAARLFNILGPGEDERHAPARFARQAVDPQTREIVAGDLSTTRDFIDVRDAASALMRLCDDNVAAGAYNVCSGIETPIGIVLDGVLQAAERKLPVVQGYSRAIDIQRQAGDVSKIAALGFSPRYSLSESLATLVEYYRSALPVPQ